MTEQKFGLIYGLTNPYFDGLVKIGLTHSLDISKRIRVLNTAVPLPFECAFAYKVPHDELYTIESLLHDNYDSKRVGNSEFFRIDSTKVDKLMGTLGKFEPMKSVVQCTIDTEVAKQKSPNMDFHKMGLRSGDVLVYSKDTSISCTVVSNKRVSYNGLEYSLSGLTRLLTGKVLRPAPYWKTTNGVPLSVLYIDYARKEASSLASIHETVSNTVSSMQTL